MPDDRDSNALRGAHLHWDGASGLAGDMFLGACLDLGMPLAVLTETVEALGLTGISVEARKARRGGFAGTRFRVLRDGAPIEGPDPEELGGGRPNLEHVGHLRGDGGATHAAASDPAAQSEAHPIEPTHRHDHDHPHSHPHSHVPERAHGHSHEPEQSRGPVNASDHARAHSTVDMHEPVSERPNASSGRGSELGDRPDSPSGELFRASSGHSRHLAEIRELIDRSALARAVKDRATDLFLRLGEAEAKAHGVALESVHFHEVGAVDSIVDLVGAAAALDWLAPARITAGAFRLGGGRTHGAHGPMSVPPPAVAELVRGVPVYGGESSDGELLTPTGAVLLAEIVDAFEPMPELVVAAVGVGLGRRETPGRANAFRMLAGRPLAGSARAPQAIYVVEAEVDDLPGEAFGFAMERLLAAGALDVYFTAVQMKKNRPGTLVSVLCRPELLEPLAGVLLAETGSLGCRFQPAGRFEAEREIVEVETALGRVRVKRARFAGLALAEAPEYEDCRRIALERGLPLRDVLRAVAQALAPR